VCFAESFIHENYSDCRLDGRQFFYLTSGVS